MITKIKFKCISEGKVRNIVIPIEHNITAPKKVGDRWESIESQVHRLPRFNRQMGFDG